MNAEVIERRKWLARLMHSPKLQHWQKARCFELASKNELTSGQLDWLERLARRAGMEMER